MDGTIEFFERVRCLLRPTDTVIDLGAGRGAWFYEDKCEARRHLRNLRDVTFRYVGVDVDPIVLTNPTTTENYVMVRDTIPLPDSFCDAIIADYVIEHVRNVQSFCAEVNRVLKPGGYFFARTPHKYSYVSLMARIAQNRHHRRILRSVQPNRKVDDIFPTTYGLNTISSIRKAFRAYSDYSYLYIPEPSYHFGRKSIFTALSVMHRLSPASFVANIFVFLQKPTQDTES